MALNYLNYICKYIIITNGNYILFTFVILILLAMKDRILEFLRSENKTSAQFAEEIGVQPSGISHILSGRNNPSLDFVVKMLEKYPYLSTEWLLFGKGTMYKDSQMQSLFDEASLIDPVLNHRIVESSHPSSGSYKEPSPVKQSSGKDISETESASEVVRIVWFYADNSFTEYYPKE